MTPAQPNTPHREPRRGPVVGKKKPYLTIREVALFAMLGAMMMVSDLVMNIIPNVHLVGVMTVVLTVVYRHKALYPIYVYVGLIGLFDGAGLWATYSYVWAILWGMVMLLPRRMPSWLAPIAYALVCGLHGFAFGFLLIPYQMVFMSFSLEQALVWWQFGLPLADVPHGIGNLVGSILVLPLVTLLRKLDKGRERGMH